LLAKHVLKNKTGIRAVTDIARFKLKESLAGVKVKVGFVGEPGSGKTSLIQAIFGEEIPLKKMEKSKDKNYNLYKYPGWRNIKFAEIPAVKTHRRAEREEYLETMKIKGYDLIVIVTENHIREWAMWMARELMDFGESHQDQ
jgi:predicted GTPase